MSSYESIMTWLIYESFSFLGTDNESIFVNWLFQILNNEFSNW